MRLVLLGVRGSTPAPGAEFVRYGGHTACVAVMPGTSDVPRLILDAGTGVRGLPGLLGGGGFHGKVALSHMHWDHVQGLPFSPGVDHDEAEVELLLPAQCGKSGRDLLASLMSPPLFPIDPEGLRGHWRFRALEPGTPVDVGGMVLTAAEVSHKGGRTFGYRVVDADGASMAYLPDHAPAAGVDDAVRALVAGVDVLLHDAQFLEPERAIADLYGHATIDDALALAAQARVGRLVLFHHAPARTDDALDELAATMARRSELPPAVVARQGDVVRVG